MSCLNLCSPSELHAVDWLAAAPHPGVRRMRECQRLQGSTKGGEGSETALTGNGGLGRASRNRINDFLPEFRGAASTAVIWFISCLQEFTRRECMASSYEENRR